MNKEARKNILDDKLGVGRFISVSLPEGLKPGSTITLNITEDGRPVVIDGSVKVNSEAEEKILEGGWCRNQHLYRRWVMAQMFRMLNYKSWDERESGFDAYLRRNYDSKYPFRMMRDEMKVLAAMKRDDDPEFLRRASFFAKDVVVKSCREYIGYLQKEIDYILKNRKQKKCKGIPYITIGNRNVYVDRIKQDIITPLHFIMTELQTFVTYDQAADLLDKFLDNMVKLRNSTKFPPTWKDAFKGAGAYYTLQNLIRFHGVRIKGSSGWCDAKTSEGILEAKRYEYHGHGYRFLGFMKDVIKYNNFDFKARMKEIGAYCL